MEDEEQGLDLGRYLGVLLHWWWVIGLAVVVLAAAGYGYSRATKTTTVYTAQATILILESRTASAPSFGNISASEQLAGFYGQLITTPRLRELVDEQLGLSGGSPSITKVSVSGRPDTPLLDIQVQGNDPEIPIRYANTLAETFIRDTENARLADIARLAALLEAQGSTDTASLIAAQYTTLGSIRILEEARSAPASVVGPSIRRNTVLGVFLGLLLGIVLAFLLEYSSNKLKSVEQIDRVFQAANLNPHILEAWPESGGGCASGYTWDQQV